MGDKQRYQSNISKPNFNLDVYSGNLSFNPRNDDVGILFVNVTVIDDNSLKGYCNFKITINNVNDPPDDPLIILPSSNSEFKINDKIDLQAGIVHDIDKIDVINYSWDFDFTDGIQSQKFGQKANHTYEYAGKYKITLTITDGIIQKSTFITLNITESGLPKPNGNGNGNGQGTEPDGKSQSDIYNWVIIAIVAILIILIIGFLLFYQRRKRSVLNKYLTEIEQANEWAMARPDFGRTKLANLKLKITNDLKTGILDQQTYVILENKINEYMKSFGLATVSPFPGQVAHVLKPTVAPTPTIAPAQSSQLPQLPPRIQPPGTVPSDVTLQQPTTTSLTPTVQTIQPVSITPTQIPQQQTLPQPTQQPQITPQPTTAQQSQKKIIKCFKCGNLVTVILAPEGNPTFLHCPKCGAEGTV
jgi:PKD repeat protein